MKPLKWGKGCSKTNYQSQDINELKMLIEKRFMERWSYIVEGKNFRAIGYLLPGLNRVIFIRYSVHEAL
ncbi:MAG TPA: hypothetical protein GXX37_06060 [Clostridiaceae bacterium]|nr:hypothetical protein [Clostridiaceae bacterium]